MLIPLAPLNVVRLEGCSALTQPALALAADLGISTIVDFEKTRRLVSGEAVRAIREALADAGIEFINENGGGPGVRLRKAQRHNRPR